MFSERLLEALNKKKMTGNTLCRIMNIDNKNFTNWKSNKIPRGEAIKQIAQILEVSTDWLLEIDEANTPEENRLIDNYRTADERGKENIISISELEAGRIHKAAQPTKKSE